MIIRLLKNLIIYCAVLSLPIISLAQQESLRGDQYQIGPDEKLLIRVHIFGEVKKPGEYLVPDDTDLLELISKAGGPTEFSNLKVIMITRGVAGVANTKPSSGNQAESDINYKMSSEKMKKQVIKINLTKLLNDEKYTAAAPTLQPGDVVRVGRNAWFTWQSVIRLAYELAIVANVIMWYSR